MRLHQRHQSIAPLATLVLLLTMCPCTTLSATREPAVETPRFALDARLVARPPSLSGARFQLQADLLPRPPLPKIQSAGFLLKASLEPAGEPACASPGFIFSSSFESP